MYTYDRRASTGHFGDEIRDISSYVRRARALVAPYKALADALETPKIATYADRIEQRISTLNELARDLRDAEKLMDSAEGGDAQARDKLTKLASELSKILDKIERQDDTGYISWDLENYVGSSAPILARIVRVSPGAFTSEAVDIIRGFLEDLD